MPVAEPFWNEKVKEWSDRIWNPAQHETVDKSNRYWTGKENEYLANQIITLPPLPTNPELKMITRKIRFHPTSNQVSFFNKCFTAHRFYYNKTIQHINQQYNSKKSEFENNPTCIHCNRPKELESWACEQHKNEKISWKVSYDYKKIKPIVMKKNKELPVEEKKYEPVPVDTRVYSIIQACSAYKSAIANKINGNIKTFEMRPVRRTNRQIFWVEHRAIKKVDGQIQLFPDALKENKFLPVQENKTKEFPDNNECAAKIMRDRGVYYIVLSIPYIGTPVNNKLTTIALDPGVRTFQTGYSPNGQVFKMGENQIEQIKQLHDRIDLLRSVQANAKGRTRNNLRKRVLKLQVKISNIVNDLHNQTGSMLAKNYREIYLPDFATSGMQQGDIPRVVKRRMNSLAHYQFQLKMQYFAKKYGCNVYLVDESYTTKTCGGCGQINETIGSAKHFTCSHCSYSLDRDIHGARNIWIKTATDNTVAKGVDSHPLESGH